MGIAMSDNIRYDKAYVSLSQTRFRLREAWKKISSGTVQFSPVALENFPLFSLTLTVLLGIILR